MKQSIKTSSVLLAGFPILIVLGISFLCLPATAQQKKAVNVIGEAEPRDTGLKNRTITPVTGITLEDTAARNAVSPDYTAKAAKPSKAAALDSTGVVVMNREFNNLRNLVAQARILGDTVLAGIDWEQVEKELNYAGLKIRMVAPSGTARLQLIGEGPEGTEYVQDEMAVSYQDGYHSYTNSSADTFRGKHVVGHTLAEREDTHRLKDVAQRQAPVKQFAEEEKLIGSRSKNVTVSTADCAALLTALYNKGLVTQNGPFNVRYDDRSLLIDGELQSAELYAAIVSYMNRKGSTVITGTRQNLYIESTN